jgi:diacylglycerol kinase
MTNTTFRDSVLCATRGLFKGISNERNIKIQLVIAFFIVLAAILLEISKTYLITIIVVCFLVVILEMFNRGFEKLIDLISPEYNKEFGKVKDIMAGVVLLTFIMALLVSLMILYHPAITFLKIASKNLTLLALTASNIFLSSIILLAYYIKKNKD